MQTRAAATAVAFGFSVIGAGAFLVVQQYAGTLWALAFLITAVTAIAFLSYRRS